MNLPARDIAILRMLRRYFYLRTSQIRDVVIPHDAHGTITRARLRRLAQQGLVRRYQPKLVDASGTTPPVFVLTLKGSSLLAAAADDSRLLLEIEPRFDDWMSMNHFCGLSSFHILLDAALAETPELTLHQLYFEHEVVRPDSTDYAKKYRLYTVCTESPRVVCVPDSAFETEMAGFRRVWYVERETGSDTPSRVAAKKARGYALMAETGLFRRLFPQADDFRVLILCPSPSWRDALRRELSLQPMPGLWLTAAHQDITQASVLRSPIWYRSDQGPFSLIPAPSAAGFSAAPSAPDVSANLPTEALT